MLFLLRILLIGTLSLLSIQYLPWYSVAGVAAIVSFGFSNKGSHAFFSSLLAVWLLWIVMNYMLYVQDGGYLGDKVAQLLMINNPYALIVVSGFLAGLCAGFGGLTGQALRQLFRGSKRNRQGYYQG